MRRYEVGRRGGLIGPGRLRWRVEAIFAEVCYISIDHRATR